MTKEQTLSLQKQLNSLGYGPLVEDGIYGPATAAAYQGYLNGQKASNELTPDAPVPPKPWWLSKGTVAPIVGVLVGLLGLARYGLSAEDLTPVIMSVLEVVLFGVAWYGRRKAQGPIDTGLVVPGVRYADGQLRRVQTPDPSNSSYWDTERGPFGQ